MALYAPGLVILCEITTSCTRIALMATLYSSQAQHVSSSQRVPQLI